MPAAARSAVLFDIDGTLVDTRSLHIDAWLRAFADVGHPVDAWRIHAAIGMDSAELLEVLLQGESDRLGAAAKERHRIHDAAAEERMRTFTGARALLDELARRGLKVVLATSSPEEESATTTRVLGAGGAVLAATTSSDVDRAKPEPDVVQVALQKAEVGAEDAMMVGDAVWDVLPAGRAGVRCIGVRTGGVSGRALHRCADGRRERRGARGVRRDRRLRRRRGPAGGSRRQPVVQPPTSVRSDTCTGYPLASSRGASALLLAYFQHGRPTCVPKSRETMSAWGRPGRA